MNSQPVELLVGNVYLIKDGKRLSFTKIDPMEHPKTETDISMSKAVPIGKTELPFKGWTVAMYPPANLVAVSEFPSKPYVTFERFLNLSSMTLKNSIHTGMSSMFIFGI